MMYCCGTRKTRADEFRVKGVRVLNKQFASSAVSVCAASEVSEHELTWFEPGRSDYESQKVQHEVLPSPTTALDSMW